MRPLLASLALLLLALYRPSLSGEASIERFDDLVSDALKEKFDKNWDVVSVTDAVDTLIANSEVHFKDATNNGVLCALADATFAETLKKSMYGDGPLTPEQRSKETDVAKSIVGVDCATTDAAKKALDEWKCFCPPENKVVTFCALHKYKREKAPTATMGKCKKAALDELKTKGTKELGAHYELAALMDEYDEFRKSLPKLFDEDVVDVISKNGDVKMLNLFCEAIDNTVAAALVTLFKSDVSYPDTNEHFFYDVLYYATYGVHLSQPMGEEERQLARLALEQFQEQCKIPDFTADPFHACICSQDKGLLYCVYNAIGTELKTAGYLTCTPGAPPAVDAAKKPKTVAPPFLKPKPKPTSAPPAPTTTAASGQTGAAAASSLLVPLAAAAAALMLRH